MPEDLQACQLSRQAHDIGALRRRRLVIKIIEILRELGFSDRLWDGHIDRRSFSLCAEEICAPSAIGPLNKHKLAEDVQFYGCAHRGLMSELSGPPPRMIAQEWQLRSAGPLEREVRPAADDGDETLDGRQLECGVIGGPLWLCCIDADRR